MRPNPAQIFIWVAAVSITIRITWTAIDHHMPILPTITIATSVLLAMKLGAEQLINIAKAAAKGANR